MKAYWQALNTIIDSVTALQDDQYHSVKSLEIKESANNFEKSLQPCLQELTQSSIRLQSLIEDSLQELAQAEDIWHSKERIANSCTSTTWEELTKLTGYSIKLKQLGKQYQSSLLEKAIKKWQSMIEELKKIYFIDAKKGIKSGIGWNKKAIFIKKIREILNDYAQELDDMIVEELAKLFQEIDLIDEQKSTYFICLFDDNSKNNLHDEFKNISQDIDNGINNISNLGEIYLEKSPLQFNSTPEAWQKKFGELSWKEVSEFDNSIIETSKSRIMTIVSNRIILANKIVERLIEFYHDLLEKQNRYRQETSEQRLAEKTWIAQQKATLQQMQLDFQSVTIIPS